MRIIKNADVMMSPIGRSIFLCWMASYPQYWCQLMKENEMNVRQLRLFTANEEQILTLNDVLKLAYLVWGHMDYNEYLVSLFRRAGWFQTSDQTFCMIQSIREIHKANLMSKMPCLSGCNLRTKWLMTCFDQREKSSGTRAGHSSWLFYIIYQSDSWEALVRFDEKSLRW